MSKNEDMDMYGKDLNSMKEHITEGQDINFGADESDNEEFGEEEHDAESNTITIVEQKLNRRQREDNERKL